MPVLFDSDLADFAKACVRPGIVGDSWLLLVEGEVSTADTQVKLVALHASTLRLGIQVVKVLPGSIVPRQTQYSASVELGQRIGKKGIRHNKTAKIVVQHPISAR